MSRFWSGILSSQTADLLRLDNTLLIVGSSAAADNSYLDAYNISNGIQGSRYSNPSTMVSVQSSNQVECVAVSPSGRVAAVGFQDSPYVHAYQWGPGWGTKFANPSTSAQTIRTHIKFSNNESSIAMANKYADGPDVNNDFQPLKIYAWSSNGFGAKRSDPASWTQLFPATIDFRITDNAILISGNVSSTYWPTNPPIVAYAWSNGFGTKFANPATWPANPGAPGSGGDSFGPAKFTHSGTNVIATVNYSPGLYAWPWSSGFGAKFADPAAAPDGTSMQGMDISFNDDAIVVSATNANNVLNAWAWSNSTGFGTKYANTGLSTLEGTKEVIFEPKTKTSTNVIAATGSFAMNKVGIFPWSTATGFGTKYVNPTSMATYPFALSIDTMY